MLLAAARFGVVGATQINKQEPDFEYFYKGGAWLLAHGNLDLGYDVVDGRLQRRGTLEWYWPCVPRFMTLLATLPFETAGYLWLSMNLLIMLATVRLLGRHLTGLPPRDWAVTQMVPLLLLAAYWHWEFRLNQIDNLTLLLIVGSFACWQQGRRALSGFWLGLAVLLKLTPGLLLVWFALKRQYRTVAVALITLTLAGPVGDLITFGPSTTADLYRAWAHNAVAGGSHRGLILAQREMDWRNQSLGAVLSRWLHPTNYNTHFDNDPRIRKSYENYPVKMFNLVSWPRAAVANIVIMIVIATVLGLLWLARHPAERLTRWRLRFEWALFILAMLWFMPVLRRYHMINALPAMALLAAGVHYSGIGSRWSKLALTGMGLAFVGQFALLYRPFEASGTILASVVVLGVPLIAMLIRLGRNPAALAPPYHAPPHPTRSVVADAVAALRPAPQPA